MFHVPPQLTTIAALGPETAADVLRLVIAGEEAARDGLLSIAASFDDLVVLGEVDADDDLAARLRILTPDVVLLDAGQSGSVTPMASVATPSLVLVHSASQRALAEACGVRGVMSSTATPRRIHAGLRAVAEGLHISDSVPGAQGGSAAAQPLQDPLTARELDVLRLLTVGLTNKEIAVRLGITEHTVKFHVNAILGKLEAETRTEAVVNAARRGIVAL